MLPDFWNSKQKVFSRGKLLQPRPQRFPIYKILSKIRSFKLKTGGKAPCFPDSSAGKESAYSTRDTDVGSIPGLERSVGVGKWQPIPVLLPGKFHGQFMESQRVRHDLLTEHMNKSWGKNTVEEDPQITSLIVTTATEY